MSAALGGDTRHLNLCDARPPLRPVALRRVTLSGGQQICGYL